MKISIWSAAALALAAIGPVACGEAPVEQAADPEAPDGIAVDHARLMLPAVPGNPAAVYFDIANKGEKDMMILSVAVQGAGSSMMHQMNTANGRTSMDEVLQIAVPAGETLSFEPGGLHVMAMDLADTVAAGGESEVTLTFAGGDKVSFPAEVRAAGDER